MDIINRIGPKIVKRDIDNIHQELFYVLNHFYSSILRVDLLENIAVLVQSSEHPECLYHQFDWADYLMKSTKLFLPEDRKRTREELSSVHLLKLYQNEKMCFSLDAYYVKDGVLCCMTSRVILNNVENKPIAYIMTRNSSKAFSQRDIFNSYVGDNCEYFIYLDIRNNIYIQFDNNINSATPSVTEYEDYDTEIKKYIEKNVVLEDRKYVMREMSLQRVLTQLELKKVHSLYCGVVAQDGSYRRKRFDYRYYECNTRMVLISCTDVTMAYLKEQAHQTALSEAMQKAHTDALTGLLNYEGITEQISKALKHGVSNGALLFVDLDNFKIVNDSLGHLTGDNVLSQFADILRREAFGSHLIGRFGGDEFVIFFSNLSSIEQVTEYAHRICQSVAQMEYGSKNNESHISCSIGIAQIPKDGCDYKTLFEKADMASYLVKATGKNRYSIYSECEKDI